MKSNNTLQVLVSAMNANCQQLVEKMNIKSDAIIINQCDKVGYQEQHLNEGIVRFFDMNERGVGLSRNNALLRATGDIVLFSDEDITYDDDYVSKVLDAFEGSDAGLFFQKKNEVITTSRYAEVFLEEFGIEADLDRISETPGLEFVRLDDDLEGYPVNHADTESFIYCKAPYPTEVLSRMLAPEIHVETASYKDPEPYSGELTLEINSKATGIEKMLEYLGREREDVIAFGDGANDLEMMEFANVSVAMGNANERVKKRADLVTTDILDDGIKNALERLSLI